MQNFLWEGGGGGGGMGRGEFIGLYKLMQTLYLECAEGPSTTDLPWVPTISHVHTDLIKIPWIFFSTWKESKGTVKKSESVTDGYPTLFWAEYSNKSIPCL